MTTTTCAACEFLPANERGDGSGWCCGSCGLEFPHDKGIHDVQYGTYHEFTCKACHVAETANA